MQKRYQYNTPKQTIAMDKMRPKKNNEGITAVLRNWGFRA